MADMQEDVDNINAAWTIVSAAVGASVANSPTASQLLGSWLFTAAVGIWGPFRAFHVQIPQNRLILESCYQRFAIER